MQSFELRLLFVLNHYSKTFLFLSFWWWPYFLIFSNRKLHCCLQSIRYLFNWKAHLKNEKFDLLADSKSSFSWSMQFPNGFKSRRGFPMCVYLWSLSFRFLELSNWSFSPVDSRGGGGTEERSLPESVAFSSLLLDMNFVDFWDDGGTLRGPLMSSVRFWSPP